MEQANRMLNSIVGRSGIGLECPYPVGQEEYNPHADNGQLEGRLIARMQKQKRLKIQGSLLVEPFLAGYFHRTVGNHAGFRSMVAD